MGHPYPTAGRTRVGPHPPPGEETTRGTMGIPRG
nr:MAG TPA: hypothetical protein [Siphoviridae sp. ctvS314]